MNITSRAVALAFLAASAVLMTSSSNAQTTRQRLPYDTRPTPAPKCCVLASRPFGTDNVAWKVQPPSSSVPVTATLISSTPYYAAALPGSQWISDNALSGQYPGSAPGQYVYTYHFCLCELPPGASGPPPAAMSLKVLSDNQFVAYLNGNQIGQNLATDTTPFTYPTSITSVPASFFQTGDNVLRFVVTNEGFAGQGNPSWPPGRIANPSVRRAQAQAAQAAQAQGTNPTGLDVAGSISGYFLDLPPILHCPSAPPSPRR